MRKLVVAVLAAVTVLGVFAVGASPATSQSGVTAKSVTIGGTFPLTGPASLYATISTSMKAYFAYVNARRGPDGKRGVGGRQIVFKIYDDGYNPANTVQQTRRLVEQDKVFAIVGALGTEHNLAIRPYLNQAKVPQILNATGAGVWSADFKTFPWTSGWQPNYEFEGRLYGRKIARNSPNAKIAVIYQNDEYGKELLRGLEAGLGAKASNIVGKESYEAPQRDVRSQVAKLRGTGATVFVVLATPAQAIQSLVLARVLGWNPPVIYVNSVSGTDSFMTTARASGAGDLVERVFTVQYAKDPANPTWDDDAGIKLYRQVLSKYMPNGSSTQVQNNSLNLYGVAVAHAFTQLLYKAGKNPTRASLMRAVRNWNEPNPFLLPGVRQKTSGDDQEVVSCERIVKFTGGVFQPVSRIQCDTGVSR
jgi:branched-chain amino acid transport system substrate-binding protein